MAATIGLGQITSKLILIGGVMDKKEERDGRNVHHKSYEGHSAAKFWAKKAFNSLSRKLTIKLDK